MKSDTSTRFAILPEGGLKEEIREWSDIETMCQTRRLSPDALIFLPEENEWRKLRDTALAACFRKRAVVGAKPDEAPSEKTPRGEEYESLLQQIRLDPLDTALKLRAAEIVRATGDIDAACAHYQDALDASPYHPRVAQEAKRNLPPSKWKRLRYLEKPPQVWEDLAAVFAYPFARGPLYLLAPTAVLTGLFWTAWTAAPAFLLLWLWEIEIVRTCSRGDKRPPLGKDLASDPLNRIAKPLAAAVAAGVEVFGAFAAIAGVLVLAHLSGETNVLVMIRKSPVLTVLLCTASLFYLPAAMILSASNAMKLRDVVNPKTVVGAIRVMETEYVESVFFVALLFAVMWGAGAFVGSIPVAGHVFFAAAAAYIVLAGGFVFGRLNARFEERLEKPAPASESDAE